MVERLRIIHCFRAPVGGLFRHVLDLSGEQAARGHEVGYVLDSTVSDPLTEQRLAKAATHLKLGITRLPDEGLAARRLRHELPAAYRRLREAADAHAIDTLWVPAYEGAHADHDCANALAAALLRERPAVAAWEFAEYNNAGGTKRANEFFDVRGGETAVALEDDMEGRWKTHLLRLYRSEAFNLRIVSAGKTAFRESFRPLPPHDYARPPHEGR